MTAFEEFGVMPEIGKAVDDMDWNLPTDVQVGVTQGWHKTAKSRKSVHNVPRVTFQDSDLVILKP